MHAQTYPQTLSTLAELVQPVGPRASSLLLSADGRFLLGIRPPVHERGRVLLRLTGIGGWADGDETFAETAVRESVEETGSGVHLLDLDQTLIDERPCRGVIALWTLLAQFLEEALGGLELL